MESTGISIPYQIDNRIRGKESVCVCVGGAQASCRMLALHAQGSGFDPQYRMLKPRMVEHACILSTWEMEAATLRCKRPSLAA